MKTILITGDPQIAADAEAAGVSRVMVDLENIDKRERQATRATFISCHTKDDIPKVRNALRKTELMVRINPWHAHSADEIHAAIGGGANLIMLPMITNIAHVTHVLGLLPPEVSLVPLVETAYSVDHLEEILVNPRIKEIYVGLNDLHLSLKLEFLFEPLAIGVLDDIARAVHRHGKQFGFGGIAVMGSGELPAERILAEHERLGSGIVILSSRFCKDIVIEKKEGRVQRIRDALHVMQQEYKRLCTRNDKARNEDFGVTASMVMRLARELEIQRQAS